MAHYVGDWLWGETGSAWKAFTRTPSISCGKIHQKVSLEREVLKGTHKGGTVQFRSIRRPCDSVTRLTKFSFRHLAFEGGTRTGFRQVSDWDGYFSNFWLSLRWSIQWRAAAEAKFTRLWINCPNLAQNCHNEVCHLFWPFVRTLRDTVTLPIFRHVRYPLWHMTNESIEIVQYYVAMPNIIIKRLVKLNQMMQKDWRRNCC